MYTESGILLEIAQNWETPRLLKLLGQQGLIGDAKERLEDYRWQASRTIARTYQYSLTKDTFTAKGKPFIEVFSIGFGEWSEAALSLTKLGCVFANLGVGFWKLPHVGEWVYGFRSAEEKRATAKLLKEAGFSLAKEYVEDEESRYHDTPPTETAWVWRTHQGEVIDEPTAVALALGLT